MGDCSLEGTSQKKDSISTCAGKMGSGKRRLMEGRTETLVAIGVGIPVMRFTGVGESEELYLYLYL